MLADALTATEKKVESLREELKGLRSSSERVFQAPPAEWIEERVAGLKEVLERRTEVSALLLRKLLGEIRLEPKAGTETGRPYYLARTSLQALEILEPPPGGPEGGSNSLRWWRRGESNPLGNYAVTFYFVSIYAAFPDLLLFPFCSGFARALSQIVRACPSMTGMAQRTFDLDAVLV